MAANCNHLHLERRSIELADDPFHHGRSLPPEEQKASRIRAAIADVVGEGKVRTYDMMRFTGGPKVISQGAASTVQMTDAILEKLK